MADHSIKGKIVIIAGGAKNLGGLIARDLAAQGRKPSPFIITAPPQRQMPMKPWLPSKPQVRRLWHFRPI